MLRILLFYLICGQNVLVVFNTDSDSSFLLLRPFYFLFQGLVY